MRSVADDVRRDLIEDQRKLSPEERIALALRLGRRDAEIFAASESRSLPDAIHSLRTRRQAGRRASASAENA